jgi:hypothetical protein
MANTITVDRENWLGYRWRGQCLGGSSGNDALADLLVLGLQGSRQSNGEQALSQRTSRIGSTSVARAITPDGPLVCMWSVRGAPHAHRAEQLDFVRDALATLDSDDGGTKYVEAVDEVAAVLKKIVKGKTAKGDASREVADTVSGSLVQHCQRCNANHVADGMFRAAGRQAEIVIGPAEDRSTMLYPAPRVKQQRVRNPRERLLEAFFRVNGPSTRTLYRVWQEVGTTGVAELWEGLGDDLVRVEIGMKRYDLPESQLDALRKARPAKGVALVPPNDPYLRQTDRGLLVPDSVRRRKVFKALAGPGALLVDGEIAGTWRYRRSDSEVTIEAFDSLDAGQQKTATKSAAAVATSTGDDEPKVTFAST